MTIPKQDWNATQRRDGTWAADDQPNIPEQALEAALPYVAQTACIDAGLCPVGKNCACRMNAQSALAAALPSLMRVQRREDVARAISALIERLAHCDTRWPATARIEPDKALEFADALALPHTGQQEAKR